MQDSENPAPVASKRTPWNKGKLTGAKQPLRPKHVWSIRTKLQMADRKRDLALFNLAIDSKLRGCDVVCSQSRGHADQPPQEGCRAVSKIKYDGAKREYLLRSRSGIYVRTGRYGVGSTQDCASVAKRP